MQSSDPNYHLPPFPPFACTSRYVPLGSVDDALVRVCRSIDASEAISLVIGPPGTGKSLLCGLIAQRFRDTHDVVVLGDCRIDDRADFLRYLLHHLHVDIRGIRESDLQLTLIDRLCSDDSAEGGLLLIIDEAQSLSADVMEAIRMVTNIMHRGIPRVTAVVCGGVKLDDMLVEPSLEAFTQRVATRCYLHPLNGEETRQYIRETIQNCGADPDTTINDQAMATIHHACSGVPRLINQLMTQAIDCAEEMDQAKITERIIDVAWAQLQQLPGPMVEEPRIVRDASAIEFGELEDDSPETDTRTGEVNLSAQNQNNNEHSLPPNPDGLDDIVIEDESGIWWDEIDVQHPQFYSERQFHSEENLSSEETSDGHSDGEANPVRRRNADESVSSEESVFGDFEVEEEIAIGSGVHRRSQREPEPPADLEQALHQEIIGLNAYLSEVLGGSADAELRTYANDDATDSAVGVEEPEEVVEDSVTVSDEEIGQQSCDTTSNDSAQKQQPPEQQPPEQQMASVEVPLEEEGEADREPNRSVFFFSDAMPEAEEDRESVKGDDKDLLVIEEELEIRRIDAAKRYDSLEQTISVDFQQMLSRMRNASR